MTTKTQNYTAEMTARAVEAYTAGVNLETIATELGRSVKSVVAKLSREGVYKAKTHEGKGRISKADLIKQIAADTGVDEEVLSSLDKATGLALQALANAVAVK